MHTTANSARRLGFSTVSLVAASLLFAADAAADEPKPDAGNGPAAADAKDDDKDKGDAKGVGDLHDSDNDHYLRAGKDYSEKSWVDGGSKPVVIPWISLPQISLRIKPIKHMQARIDAGFSVTGFFTGLSAGYGF